MGGEKSEGSIAPESQQKGAREPQRHRREYRGVGCRKIYFVAIGGYLEFILLIFVTNKYVLLLFYFYR